MSTDLTRQTIARRRWSPETNTITFPTALRDAIPDLPTSAGRVLKLDTVSGELTDSPLYGPRVHLTLLARETGKLTGSYPIRIDLDPGAALALAEHLTKLVQVGKE
jgi:hypothetical protein